MKITRLLPFFAVFALFAALACSAADPEARQQPQAPAPAAPAAAQQQTAPQAPAAPALPAPAAVAIAAPEQMEQTQPVAPVAPSQRSARIVPDETGINEGGKAVFALGASVKTIDPVWTTATVTYEVSVHLYEFPFRLDPNGCSATTTCSIAGKSAMTSSPGLSRCATT